MEGDDGPWRMVGVGNHGADSSYPIVLCVDHHKEKNGGAERGFSCSSCGVLGTVFVDMAGQDTRFLIVGWVRQVQVVYQDNFFTKLRDNIQDY